MPDRKQPTNAENGKRLDMVEFTLQDHTKRISILEQAKIATDAVADYLVKHPSVAQSENKLNKDLVKVVLTFLGVATAAIYLAQDVLKALLP